MIGKRINGRTYYYLVESERVSGRPRIVSQRYLGTADAIAEAMRGQTAKLEHSWHLAFGDVAAVWHVMRQLDIVRIVDTVVGRQRAKVSVGRFVALAVLHRVIAPNADFAEWWSGTSAGRFVRPTIPGEAFDHKRFWRAMGRLHAAERQVIESRVSAAVFDLFGDSIDTKTLVVDVPGFATYVSADKEPESVTGMTMLVSLDGAIPLASCHYQHDRSNSTPFEQILDQIMLRYQSMENGGSKPTLIFEAGQHVRLNLDSGTHFVGALPHGDYPELLAEPATSRIEVDQRRFPGVTALDTRMTVAGVNRRVILTHSGTLHAAQARAFTQTLGSAVRQLDGLARALAAGTYRQSRDHVLAEIARITRLRWIDRVVSTTVSGTKPGDIRLRWLVDDAARVRLGQDHFGKQLLVTDHEDWPIGDVIAAYRARHHVDSTFRKLNDPFVAGLSQHWQWNADRIAAHGFVTVLAATVLHVLRQRADQSGLDYSAAGLLDRLSGIRETVLRYRSTGGRPRTHRMLNELDNVTHRLYELFELENYAPQ